MSRWEEIGAPTGRVLASVEVKPQTKRRLDQEKSANSYSWRTAIPPPSPFVGLRYAPASSRTGWGDDLQHLVAQKCPGLLAPRQQVHARSEKACGQTLVVFTLWARLFGQARRVRYAVATGGDASWRLGSRRRRSPACPNLRRGRATDGRQAASPKRAPKREAKEEAKP